MTNDFKALSRPPSLFESTQSAIREFILTNNLKPGDMLPPEGEIARKLGVSRNAVREAIKGLESLGYVEARRGSGIFVGNFSLDLLLNNLPFELISDLEGLYELLQIRRILESAMMEAAIVNMTDEQLAGLREIVDGMRTRAEQSDSFPIEDRAFHRRLFESTGNKTLLKLLDVFWFTYSRASKHTGLEDYNPMNTYQDHLAIFQAVADRDVERARAALNQHYTSLGALESRIKNLQEGQNH